MPDNAPYLDLFTESLTQTNASEKHFHPSFAEEEMDDQADLVRG